MASVASGRRSPAVPASGSPRALHFAEPPSAALILDLRRSSVRRASLDPVEVRFVCAGPQGPQGSTLVAIAAAEGRPEVALLLDAQTNF